jgi:hypothetical protein
MPAYALAVVSPFTEAEEKFAELIDYLSSGESHDLTHSELERELDARGRELLRNLLQAHLDTRSPGPASVPVRDRDGLERTQERVHERGLKTVFGEVEVHRVGYGADGSKSLHPLDAELNLPPESYSHELRRRAAEEAAKISFDEAVESLARHTGTKVPKRQLEQLVQRAACDFDAYYVQRAARAPPDAAESSLMVLSFDGKGVVMHFEDLREQTRKAAAKRSRKLKKRLSKGEKRNAKRMATVAAVYTIAPFVRAPEQIARQMAPIHEVEKKRRPKPDSKRVWASLKKEPKEVMEEALQEALRCDPAREKKWAVLVDGNETQLRILHHLRRQHDLTLTVVLDIMHVVEYLWKASFVFNAEGSPELEGWVSDRLLRILQGRSSHVAAGIRRSATRRGLAPEQREAADDCADYLLKYASYLRYDEYLAAGLPIATGVIEGACRHLVKDRMALTGARWRLDGAEAVLRLRALRASGDFDEYWHFHEAREYERNHTALYANHRVPTTKKPQSLNPKAHLRIVK